MPQADNNCANCRYFLRIAGQQDKGVCRRDPPKLPPGIGGHDYIRYASADGRWPPCFTYEWCGGWERNN